MTRQQVPEALGSGSPDDVVTGVVEDRFYAIPRGWIRRAAERDSALGAARTFADARAVRDAGHDIPDVDHPDWVEHLVEDGTVEDGERVPDDTPFDSSTHPAFWEAQWCRTLEQGTSAFLPDSLKERFGVPDTAWGMDYEPADVVLLAADADQIEAELRAAGHTVVRDASLVVLYS